MKTAHFILLAFLSAVYCKSFFYSDTGKLEDACVLLDIDFTLNITATRNDSVLKSVVKTSNDEINVTGSCSTPRIITLKYPDGLSWFATYTAKDNTSTMNRLTMFVPKDVFGDIAPYTDPVTFDDPGTTSLGYRNTSYVCYQHQDVTYNPNIVVPETTNFSVQVIITEIHTQAFEIKDGFFAPDVTDCADQTTTACSTEPSTEKPPESTPASKSTTISPPKSTSNSTTQETTESTSRVTTSQTTNSTTQTPTVNTTSSEATNSTVSETTLSTTVKPEFPPANNYTVSDGNITCVRLEAGLRLHIAYMTNTSDNITEVALVDVRDGKSSGNCSLTVNSQSLVINFKQNWTLQINFALLKSNLNVHHDYKIQDIVLKYSVNSQDFPNAALPTGTNLESKSTIKNTEEYPRKSGDHGYYKCNSELTLKVDETVEVHTQKMYFKAFNDGEDATFSGSPDECGKDADKNDLLPIIVGCCLAGVIVIVTAIFICKLVRNKRIGYQEI